MKRTSIKTPLIASLLTLALGGGFALTTSAQAAMSHDSVVVVGQSMLPSKDIVDNAVNSADHTTLVAAVKAAGLVDTLKGKGPFTVFAPVNSAFTALPAGTVDTLLKPENKATLTKILTYHVVAGKLDMMALAEKIKAGGGKTELTTVAGGKLWATMNGPHNITIKDEKGDVADITTYDVYPSKTPTRSRHCESRCTPITSKSNHWHWRRSHRSKAWNCGRYRPTANRFPSG